jgi:hypothetical protein
MSDEKMKELHQAVLDADEALLKTLRETEFALERAIAQRLEAMNDHRIMIERVREQQDELGEDPGD